MGVTIRINGAELMSREIAIDTSDFTIHSGEVESSRSKWVKAITSVVMGSVVQTRMFLQHTYVAHAAGTATAASAGEEIRKGFMEIIDVFTAIAEPILWFYALIGCIMIATGKNRQMGWTRLKNVAYGYITIIMLPTFFDFLHWVAKILGHSIHIH